MEPVCPQFVGLSIVLLAVCFPLAASQVQTLNPLKCRPKRIVGSQPKSQANRVVSRASAGAAAREEVTPTQSSYSCTGLLSGSPSSHIFPEMSRPESTGHASLFYNAKEARKYDSSSRMVGIQREITERAIELLRLPPGPREQGGRPSFVLDVGCGSGLSGQVRWTPAGRTKSRGRTHVTFLAHDSSTTILLERRHAIPKG